jgi:hypothetical protein
MSGRWYVLAIFTGTFAQMLLCAGPEGAQIAGSPVLYALWGWVLIHAGFMPGHPGRSDDGEDPRKAAAA